MSIISIPFTFSVGAVIIAAQHNSNFSTIYSDYNGNITDANIASSAGIEYSKLALSNSIQSTDILSSTVFAIGNIPTGTTANKVVELDGSGKLPAVDGSQLTNLTQVTLASILDYGTSQSASTARAQSILRVAYGTVSSVTGGSTVSLSNLPFTSSSSYTIQVTETGGSGTDENRGTIGATPTSGSAATIYNTDNANHACAWFAIGI